MVPIPPINVIRITSPLMPQWTSVSEASWKTMALVPPARPASPADGDRSHQQAERGAHQGREEDGQLGRPTPGQRRVGAGVAGAAEEKRVAEREQAHVSDQKVEGAGEEREAERLHREDGVDEPGR